MPTFLVKNRTGTERLFDGMSAAGEQYVADYDSHLGGGAKVNDLYVDVFSTLQDAAGANMLVTYGAAEGEREISIDVRTNKIQYASDDGNTKVIALKGNKDDNGNGREKVTMNWPQEKPDLTGSGSGKYLDDICQIIKDKYDSGNAAQDRKTRAFLLAAILMSKCR